MEGGPSHLDLLDLKPEAPKEIRGPYRPIDTSVPGVQISELFPHFARQLHRCTLVRSVCHDQTVHDPAVYQMLTGYRHVSTAGGLKVEADDVPHMAAAFQRALTVHGAMPPAIELPETMHMEGRILPGQNAGFLGASWDPLRVRLSPQGEVSQPEFQLRPDVTFDRYADARIWPQYCTSKRENGPSLTSPQVSMRELGMKSATKLIVSRRSKSFAVRKWGMLFRSMPNQGRPGKPMGCIVMVSRRYLRVDSSKPVLDLSRSIGGERIRTGRMEKVLDRRTTLGTRTGIISR